jgi:hypothetical protein
MGLKPTPASPPAKIVLSPAILGVPERKGHVERLITALGRDVPVFFDDDHVGTIYGGICATMRALEARELTHVLIMEDDCIPCKDFLAGAAKALSYWPKDPVSFWSAKNGPVEQRAVKKGLRWITWPSWYCTVAFALPVNLACDFMEWATAPWRHDYVIGKAEAKGHTPDTFERTARAWDVYLAYFLEDRGLTMWHTMPNLVQHGEPKTTTAGSSLDDWIIKWRTSPHFIGEAVSPLSLRGWQVR